ncbi:hypothetical protein FGD77_17955 [Roseovarius sp. M141]|nr:hypothetical protein [Roseovarius sp. M141]
MLIANLLAGSLGRDLPDGSLADWGIGHDSVLSGEVFRLITSIFLSHDADMFGRQVVFAAAAIGYTEWTRASAVTALLFFGLDIAGTLILLACVGWAAGWVDLTSMNDVGMSIGGFGLIGVAIAQWRGKWLLLSVILLAIMAKFSIEPDLLADGGHVLALLLGFAVHRFLPLSRLKRSRGPQNAR